MCTYTHHVFKMTFLKWKTPSNEMTPYISMLNILCDSKSSFITVLESNYALGSVILTYKRIKQKIFELHNAGVIVQCKLDDSDHWYLYDYIDAAHE